MPALRLATFDTGGLAVPLAPTMRDERLLLQALAIGETAADVVALQGIPSLAALEACVAAIRIGLGLDYRHALLLGGNDARGGHPALIARLPIVHARSHRAITFAELDLTPPLGLEPETPVLSRDCLEVAIELQGRALALFVCRFVTAPAERTATASADRAREHRQAEALAVRRVIEQRFADPAAAEWVVLGNLGEQPADERGVPDPNHGLGPLLDNGFAVDLLGETPGPPGGRWTHYDVATGRYRRLDHLLLSPALARRNKGCRVRIVRAGLPYRAERHAGPRYPRIGWLEPAAGWHCPVVADLCFGGAAPVAPRRYRSGGGRPGRAL